MKNLKETQQKMNYEMEQFTSIIQQLLPKYIALVEKPTLSLQETYELGEIEYSLVEINDKLNCIREQITRNLFGYSLDNYYKLKKYFVDSNLEMKLNHLKKTFESEIREGDIIIWN
jgi:hypothetical protein